MDIQSFALFGLKLTSEVKQVQKHSRNYCASHTLNIKRILTQFVCA